MTIYGFYVFDRHCTCTFYASYAGKPPKPTSTSLPAVFRSPSHLMQPNSGPNPTTSALPPWERITGGAGLIGTTGTAEGEGRTMGAVGEREKEFAKNGLVFDEEAKLVYGIIFSLRNMVKKLSLRDEDSFHSFSTTSYKLHYLHTGTSNHFVLITAPMNDSLRATLRQIYAGPFLEFVVRNPAVEVDSRISGKGVDNDRFREAVDRILAPL